MEHAFTVAALWLFLAVLSALVASALRLSIALVEICVGVLAASLLSAIDGAELLAANSEWLRVLAAVGAVLLTFLAGAELDPKVMRTKLVEVNLIGFIGFFAPFLGCTALAYYGLGWTGDASWLAGIALSTTSMAIVYAVMLETGLNQTEFGKGILGACFINDLGTVMALGLLFSPFTHRTAIFMAVATIVLGTLPASTNWLTHRYGHREDFWSVSLYQPVSGTSQGTMVLYAVDVHGINLWHDLRTVWTRAWSDKRRAVFFSGGSRHSECGCTNHHCWKSLFADSLDQGRPLPS